jgi:hypothetical protein
MPRTMLVKSVVVKLRIAPSDVKPWRDAARADRVSLADWIRRRCDGRPATAPTLPKAGR